MAQVCLFLLHRQSARPGLGHGRSADVWHRKGSGRAGAVPPAAIKHASLSYSHLPGTSALQVGGRLREDTALTERPGDQHMASVAAEGKEVPLWLPERGLDVGEASSAQPEGWDKAHCSRASSSEKRSG